MPPSAPAGTLRGLRPERSPVPGIDSVDQDTQAKQPKADPSGWQRGLGVRAPSLQPGSWEGPRISEAGPELSFSLRVYLHREFLSQHSFLHFPSAGVALGKGLEGTEGEPMAAAGSLGSSPPHEGFPVILADETLATQSSAGKAAAAADPERDLANSFQSPTVQTEVPWASLCSTSA